MHNIDIAATQQTSICQYLTSHSMHLGRYPMEQLLRNNAKQSHRLLHAARQTNTTVALPISRGIQYRRSQLEGETFGTGLLSVHPHPMPKADTFVATTAAPPRLKTLTAVRLLAKPPSEETKAARPLLTKISTTGRSTTMRMFRVSPSN